MVWIGERANILQSVMLYGFIVFFGIFFCRMILKNDYASALAAAFLFAMINDQSAWSSPHAVAVLSFYVIMYAILLLFLLRLGLVVTIVGIFVVNNLVKLHVDNRFSGWYTPYGLATMAFMISIAVYTFWRSIGSRSLGDEEAG
jgi:hypothetical protein